MQTARYTGFRLRRFDCGTFEAHYQVGQETVHCSIHEMRKKSPEKEFIPAPPNDSTCACNECNFMRLNTMEKLYNCLKYEMPEIFVDGEVQKKAIKPIRKMLEISEKLGL